MNETLIKALTIAAILLVSSFACRLYFKETNKGENNRKSVSSIAKAGVFGALSALLYVVPIFTIRLPFFPEFLTLHFDEVPVLIVGLAEGPWCAFLTLLCKTLIKLPFTTTASVGEWADLALSLFFILPVCFIYKGRGNWKALLLGLAISTPLQLIMAMVLNVYALVPFYSSLYGIPLDSLLAICQAANPAIRNLEWGYALFAVLPFNAMKDTFVIALSLLLYKSLKTFLEKH